MALTDKEKARPDMIPSDRIMTWQEFVEWLRLTADRWEAGAREEDAKNLPADQRSFSPTDLYDWVSWLLG